ncbi:MurR/RpiR family transcriptional regulator [Vagococcus sp. PNs007]|uniref:MurR/RpiR family transcriptional regulator n=1 Tax=Vagococcus proximus TaxID=2991417 RepID=A0ABT5WZA3_9ENTE|nr:MurR/RpiR family transcriptional regulator [Vagococcus proximus]MDF0478931.1 MurR/RpiR family transcriptional regulator [Vagococcus proximus]
MKSEVMTRIESMYEQLANSEKKVAKYIISNRKDIIDMSIQEASQKIGVSASTIMRFCKTISIDSYSALKIELAKINTNETKKPSIDITPNETIDGIKDKLLANAYYALSETVSLQKNDKIEKVTEKMQICDHIFVYGLGASGLVARDMTQKWNRVGKHLFYSEDVHLLISSLSAFKKNSMLILISHSGNTEEILRIANIAKKLNIFVVSICQLSNNRLSKKADISLETVKTNESELRSGATSSLQAQLMVVDIIFYAYLTKNYENAIDDIANSRKLINEFSKK